MTTITLTDEEKAEILDDLNNDEYIYRENLHDYKLWNENKQDSFMSKFNQKECDDKLEYIKRKIVIVTNLKKKILQE